jgi:hypothetical protein
VPQPFVVQKHVPLLLKGHDIPYGLDFDGGYALGGYDEHIGFHHG